MTISVQKSGPSSRHSALITFGFFGFPPDRLSWVNCSSGHSMTSSGPNTTLPTNRRLTHTNFNRTHSFGTILLGQYGVLLVKQNRPNELDKVSACIRKSGFSFGNVC